MALTLDDVKRVAHLARIAINDDEAQSTQAQLAGIFKMIGDMEAVDVSHIVPMSHAQDVTQRLRNDDEAQSTQAQLAGIFKMIGDMEAVDVRHIVPMSHAQDVTQRLRNDDVTEPNLREQFQAVAPQVEAGLYLVPRVIE